jgi:hypothetical protein
MPNDLDTYLTRYHLTEAPVFDVGPTADVWPAVVVKAGDKTAVLHLMNVAAQSEDPGAQHLCIDVRAFIDGQLVKLGAFGMDNGRRIEAFSDEETGATSHQWNAVQMVAVLVGQQQDKEQK